MIDELVRHLTESGGPAPVAAVALFAAYLMPLAIAAIRGHRYTRTIGALNLVLGWTVLGWFAALFWALNRDLREQAPVEFAPPLREPPLSLEPVWNDPEFVSTARDNPATRICPYCAEAIKAEAVVCRYCARDLATAPQDTLPASLDERGMQELYDLLQDMERDASQALRDSKLDDLLRHSGHSGSDSIGTGESRIEAIPAAESRLETFKAERLQPDQISTDEIVHSRDAGITASGRQSSRIKKAG